MYLKKSFKKMFNNNTQPVCLTHIPVVPVICLKSKGLEERGWGILKMI